jgi:hypothetical protein
MSFIQSTYGTPNSPGNFEAVLLQGKNLVHYYRDNTNGGSKKWSRTTVISSKATGPGSIIQSSYSTPYAPGNFEVVVLEGNNLVHYYRDNSSKGKEAWRGGTVITSKATGPGTVIQSSYSTPNAPGNLEVIVPEGDNFVHYSRDDSAAGGLKWSPAIVVAPTKG